MKIVFWQRVMSPHQAPLARELADRLGPDGVTCLFRSHLYADLRQQGWEEPDYGKARVVVGLTRDVVDRAIVEAGRGAVHIFSSLSHDSILRQAYRAAAANGNVLGLLSEARDWQGWKGVLRRVDSFRHERRWRHELAFVLAMGGVGRHWFHSCDYDAAKIFDFCYVVEGSDFLPVPPAAYGPVRIVCVAQLIPRKRVDLVLQAAAAMSERNWVLEIIGSGALRESLERLARDLGLANRVHFRGALVNSEVRARLAGVDLLVLASDWDGWGAVVNEALSTGTRAVCSDRCGAADLLQGTQYGWIFRQGSVTSLAAVLDRAVLAGAIDPATRVKIREYSSSFAGPAVAEYLQSIVTSVVTHGTDRPAPPWRALSERRAL